MSPIHRNEGEISALGRAALLLKEFRSSDGTLSGAALVRRTGLPKSTVHRMLRELVRVELLEQVGSSYRLGLLLFELGQMTPRQSNLHHAAHPHMAALHEATRHNVGLAVLADGEVIYVDLFRGRDAPRLPQRTGSRWPAHASCSGKAILAFSDPDQVRAIMAGRLQRLTEHTIVDPVVLGEELRRVRERGVAYDRRESFPNVVGVASPIIGPDDRVAGALSMSGLAGRISLSRVDAAVRAAALMVSRQLAREPVVSSYRR